MTDFVEADVSDELVDRLSPEDLKEYSKEVEAVTLRFMQTMIALRVKYLKK